MTRKAVFAALLSSLAVVGGCGRAHLAPSHGEAFRKAFTPQLVGGPPAVRPVTMTLDPQEADVIAQAYLRGLAGKTRVETSEPVIYVAPQQHGGAPQRLAPSVPSN